jgi:hypothetical protein
MVVFTRALHRRARIPIAVGIVGAVTLAIRPPQLRRLPAPPHSVPQLVLPDRVALPAEPPASPLQCVHSVHARTEARSP